MNTKTSLKTPFGKATAAIANFAGTMFSAKALLHGVAASDDQAAAIAQVLDGKKLAKLLQDGLSGAIDQVETLREHLAGNPVTVTPAAKIFLESVMPKLKGAGVKTAYNAVMAGASGDSVTVDQYLSSIGQVLIAQKTLVAEIGLEMSAQCDTAMAGEMPQVHETTLQKIAVVEQNYLGGVHEAVLGAGEFFAALGAFENKVTYYGVDPNLINEKAGQDTAAIA